MGTPESAESTNPYEFLLQICGISTQTTQNHTLGPKVTFALKSTLGVKSTLFRKKLISGPKSALWLPGGSENQFGLTFQSIKGSQTNVTGHFWAIWPQMVKYRENSTFGVKFTHFHEIW